jgi:hypothetical protein
MLRDRNDVSIWASLEMLSICLSESKEERNDRVDERKDSSYIIM